MSTFGSRYSQHSFAKPPTVNIPRSKMDRSYQAKDTYDFDYLTPFFVDKMYPGDTVNLNVKTFQRLAPQVRPLMDNVIFDWFFFFVPYRLTWENFEKFLGFQENPSDSIDFTIPQMRAPAVTGFPVGSLADHFGIPTGVVPATPGDISVDAAPFLGYNLIWNTWFRDQNFDNSAYFSKGNGPYTYQAPNFGLLLRNKPHDYFTSAFASPQKGTAVGTFLTGTAPVIQKPGTMSGGMILTDNVHSGWSSKTGMATSGVGAWQVTPGNGEAYLDPNGNLVTNFDATSSTANILINSLRQSFMVQSFLELNMRGGTRFIEMISSHFGVHAEDYRLQRPELLSISRTTLSQHPLPQTSQTTEDSPQGNLAAFSTMSQMSNHIGFSKSFVEHGWVIGLVQARGEVTYQYGQNRKWNALTRYDFYWPKFQEMGEQAILNKELFLGTNPTINDTAWGYQERFGDLRYHPSEIRGQFRSSYPLTLDVWHLAQEWTELQPLSAGFLKSDTPIERALVVPDEDYPHLLADYYFDYMHARPMVTYPTPATLGRF